MPNLVVGVNEGNIVHVIVADWFTGGKYRVVKKEDDKLWLEPIEEEEPE